MVMLSLFVHSGYNVGVAHCNFQLRGKESEEDEVLVEQHAQQLGVPFYNKRFDTQGEIDRSGESVQMVARRLRYDWFNSLCVQEGYTHIAIAHHADDSVETFFINLLRGTGLRGLTGINVINGLLIRPLLFSTRKDILEYAKANKIQYREDSSNSSTKYLRNKIRLGIIPRIREVSANFTHTMTANVDRLTAAQLFIDRGIDVIRQEAVTEQENGYLLDLSKIDPCYPLNFVIFELLNKFGFNAEVVDGLCRSLVAQNTGSKFYSKDYVAYIDRGNVIIEPIAADDYCETEIDSTTTKVHCRGVVLDVNTVDIDDIDELKQPENVALVDKRKLQFPLHIRLWKEGDSFVPFGMSGHKKLSDYFIDSKISMPEKNRQLVVVSGEDIVWIVGRRIDQRFCIDSSTEDVLVMKKDII